MKGIGVDIVQISRFLKEEGASKKMAQRILTSKELSIYEQKKELNLLQAQRFLAKRFASKEAASKALGTGIAKGVSFMDFNVSNNELGAPIIQLTGQALALFEQKNANQISLSISDEKDYAVAFVVIN